MNQAQQDVQMWIDRLASSPYQAAEKLGDLADPSAVEALCAAARLGDPYLSVVCAEALVKIGDPRAIALLQGCEWEDDRHQIYGSVASAMAYCMKVLRAKAGEEEKRALGIAAIGKLCSSSAQERTEARAILREMGAEAVGLLSKTVLDEDPVIRMNATDLLSMMAAQHPEAARLAWDRLYDSDYRVRRAALGALRYSKSRDAVGVVMMMLDDESSAVRQQAAITSTFLGPDEGLTLALESRAKSEKEASVREAVEKAYRERCRNR